jgi:hypothetical protein
MRGPTAGGYRKQTSDCQTDMKIRRTNGKTVAFRSARERKRQLQ